MSVVLIVEDNEKNMKLARDVLRAKGYATLEAAASGGRYSGPGSGEASEMTAAARTTSVGVRSAANTRYSVSFMTTSQDCRIKIGQVPAPGQRTKADLWCDGFTSLGENRPP